jgi:hypothetical protein
MKIEVSLDDLFDEIEDRCGEDEEAEIQLLAEKVLKKRGVKPLEGGEHYTQAQRDLIYEEFIPNELFFRDIFELIYDNMKIGMENEVAK